MDEQKQLVQESLDGSIHPDNNVNCQSNYLLDYSKILNTSCQKMWSEQQLQKYFAFNHVTYLPNHFQENLSIKVVQFTTNYEAIQLKVSYGHFEGILTVANVDTNCVSTDGQKEYGGAFGSVCQIKYEGSYYAMKKVKIPNDRFYQIFREVVKQYFILAIASILNIGPMVQKIFGFDIIVFKDCITFSMEFCQGSNVYEGNIVQLLKSKLYLLHKLQIVHMDIKPENITFSPSYQEYVFIDFGLSKMVKQTIGQQSLTRFSGSLNYCCNEMLECYNSSNLGLVDLYYNDAHCLKTTLNYLHSQRILNNDMDQMEYFENVLENINFELIQIVKMFRMKSDLFKIAIYSHCINYGTKALEYIQKFEALFVNMKSNEVVRTEICKYISTLPQSINILNIQNKHKEVFNNKQLQQSNSKSQYQQLFTSKFDESIISPQILSRFYQMKHSKLQTDPTYTTQVSNELASQMLFNQNKLQSIKLPVYKMMLSNFIKINNTTLFAKKAEACGIFTKMHMGETQQKTLDQIYKRTICLLWNSSLTESDSYKIIKNLTGTVIILELVEQDQLIGSIETIFSMKCNFLQKISLAFEFMQHIKLLKYKYKSRYDYQRLFDVLMPKFYLFLQKIPIDGVDQSQLKIIKMLKCIITLKINVDELDKQKNSNFQVILQKQRLHQTLLNELSDTIFVYLLALEIQLCLDAQDRCPQKYIVDLILWLNKLNRFSFKFTPGYLLLFDFYFQIGQISSCHIIYSQFIRRLHPYEEHKNFNIYFFNKYNTLKQLLSKNHYRGQLTPHEEESDLEIKVVCDQIFVILSDIIKNKPHFHYYLRQILKIKSLQFNQTLVDCILRLYDNNSQKMSKLSYKYHKNGPNLHRNTLRNEIGTMNNLNQFLFGYKQIKEEKLQILQRQFLQYEKLIQSHSCFECKAAASLQIRLIYSNYLQFKNLPQQSFLCIIDLLILCLKHNQLHQKKVSLLVHLMRLCWVRFDRFQSLYDPRILFYETIKEQDRYYLLFVDIEEYNLFLNMYVEIAKRDPEGVEMADFIYHAAKSLQNRNSVNSIDTFYYSILRLIKTIEPALQYNFKMYHVTVLARLLKRQKLKENPYISLYLLVILQIKMNTEAENMVFAFISFSLASLRSYPKHIILSRYYYLFTRKFNIPLRRLIFLNKKHLRYTTQKYTIKKIMTLKMTKDDVGRRNRPPIKLLISKIKNYHQNLMNIEGSSKY